LESSPALDRACRHPPSRQGGYVEYTYGVANGAGDEACIPAGGAVGENGDTTGVCDYGGVAGGARIAKRKVRLVADDKVGALEELLTMPAPVMLIEVKMDGDVAKI
jgi:hypothetical protein